MGEFLMFLKGMSVLIGGIVITGALALWIIALWSPPAETEAITSWLAVLFSPIYSIYSRLPGRSKGSWAQDKQRLNASPECRASEAAKSSKQFRTVREAKDYLAGRIAREAELEGIPLSDVERKMLYFSETDWTLPDMKEISDQFERDYDENSYEEKIVGLVRAIESSIRSGSRAEEVRWDGAIQILSAADHYLLVLLSAPGGNGRMRPLWLRVLLTLLAMTLLLVLSGWSKQWFRSH